MHTKPMKVLVDIGAASPYTYEADFEVKVGDKVEFPTAEWMREYVGDLSVGIVVAIGSDYTGPLVKLLRVLK